MPHPSRGFANPPPLTSAAKTQLQSFYCSLCNKGYARHPDYLSHLSSYDHSHKVRLKDMKEMSRDPKAAEKARRAESKETGVVKMTVKIDMGGSGGAGGGFKKGGFKSAFGGDAEKGAVVVKEEEGEGENEIVEDGHVDGESETDEEDYYDPRRPTGCWAGCAGR